MDYLVEAAHTFDLRAAEYQRQAADRVGATWSTERPWAGVAAERIKLLARARAMREAWAIVQGLIVDRDIQEEYDAQSR